MTTKSLQEIVDGLDLTGVEQPCWFSAAVLADGGPTRMARLLCAINDAGLAANDVESNEDMDDVILSNEEGGFPLLAADANDCRG